MKEIVVISGKGGTGKTTLMASFAVLAGGEAVMVDADVDAANLSLVLTPQQLESHPFIASSIAVLDRELCTECGLCRELCRFDAISENYEIDPISCEGCTVCSRACPEEAIEMKEVVSGHWFLSQTPYGKLIHARLGIAEENSGRLVTLVRNEARKLATAEEKKFLLTDGPPGIGCPVIASLSGANLALIVTEPTVSGIHDLKRVLQVCRHFNVPAAVCINRCDLDEDNSRAIESYCREESVDVISRIPFYREITEALVQGKPVVNFTSGPAADDIASLWQKISVYGDQ
ncbi:MAG: 4Fe-4S binding protein [Firmicutes bacterium]|jgi:MinD superfamily P-loop ATPase|nr:4Fe-4S binding protein [Bacillota bacterium]